MDKELRNVLNRYLSYVHYTKVRVQLSKAFEEKKASKLTQNQLKYRAPVSQIKIGAGYKQMRGLVGNMFHGITAYSLNHLKRQHICSYLGQ